MQNLFDTLKNILSEDKRFVTEKVKYCVMLFMKQA